MSDQPSAQDRGMETEPESLIVEGLKMASAPSESTKATKGTLFMSIVLAAFGIFWMISSTQIPVKATTDAVGPRFFPFWSGMILTLVSALMIVLTLRTRQRTTGGSKEEVEVKPPQQWRVYGAFAALLLYILLLTRLHFFINTAIVSAFGLALGGEPLKPRLLLFAMILSAIIYGIFVTWLQVPLPGSRIGT